MKKLLLILMMTLSFIGCSTSNDEPLVQTNDQYFHPPSWIQGTWVISGTNTQYFKFTSDDFILISPYTSYTEVMQKAAATGQTAKVDEQISETNYTFSMTAGISYGTYIFTKISPTKMQRSGNGSSIVYFDKL
jgi:hypothetical protein